MDRVSEPSTAPARPPQVTVACGIVMVGSVFVVLSVWDRIAGLHTIDTREALRPWLDEPVMRSSGITMSDLLVTVKIVSMVAAACAAGIAVLGFQALRRSRSARLVMSVLAVPMFLAGLAADGIFSSGVAAAVATLWFGPARAWFQDGPATEKADRAVAPAALQIRRVARARRVRLPIRDGSHHRRRRRRHRARRTSGHRHRSPRTTRPDRPGRPGPTRCSAPASSSGPSVW
jgi:hypothetical protein